MRFHNVLRCIEGNGYIWLVFENLGLEKKFVNFTRAFRTVT